MIQNFALGVVAFGLLALPIFLIYICICDMKNDRLKTNGKAKSKQ